MFSLCLSDINSQWTSRKESISRLYSSLMTWPMRKAKSDIPCKRILWVRIMQVKQYLRDLPAACAGCLLWDKSYIHLLLKGILHIYKLHVFMQKRRPRISQANALHINHDQAADSFHVDTHPSFCKPLSPLSRDALLWFALIVC